MHARRSGFASSFVLLAVVVGCGSSDSGSSGTPGSIGGASSSNGGSSGSGGASLGGSGGAVVGAPSIDPSTAMPSLTSTQVGEVCDWQSALLGGYGAVYHCPSGNIDNYSDQSQCIAGLSFSPGGCTLTVGEYETCVLARVPSGGCDYPSPQCDKFFLCHRR